MDYSELIKSNYEQQLKDKIAAANAQNAANKLPYQQNIDNAGVMYDSMKGDAYVKNEAARRALAERMANMGMSGTGGTSVMANYNLKNSLIGDLANADLQKQGYINEQNVGIAQSDIANQARIADITAENRLGMNAGLLDQIKYMQDYYTNLYLGNKLTKSAYENYIKSLGG